MVYGIGVNDMPKGWKRKTEWNLRVYTLWRSMLCRCYDKKYHEKFPTYKDCYVCERWINLSNFVEDVTKIENYNLWLENPKKRIALDKDIKVKNNKCYCLDNCKFVTVYENNKQMISTRNNDYLKGKTNPRAKKVCQYNLNGDLIKIWDYIREASKELNIRESNISQCLVGKQKTAGGFKWKYFKEEK